MRKTWGLCSPRFPEPPVKKQICKLSREEVTPHRVTQSDSRPVIQSLPPEAWEELLLQWTKGRCGCLSPGKAAFKGGEIIKPLPCVAKLNAFVVTMKKNACKSLAKLQKTCTQNRSHFLMLAIDQETLDMEDFIHEPIKNIIHLWGSNTYEILYTEIYNERNQGAWKHGDVCSLYTKTQHCKGTKFWKNDQ